MRDRIAIHSPSYYRGLLNAGRTYRGARPVVSLFTAWHDGDRLAGNICIFWKKRGSLSHRCLYQREAQSHADVRPPVGRNQEGKGSRLHRVRSLRHSSAARMKTIRCSVSTSSRQGFRTGSWSDGGRGTFRIAGACSPSTGQRRGPACSITAPSGSAFAWAEIPGRSRERCGRAVAVSHFIGYLHHRVGKIICALAPGRLRGVGRHGSSRAPQMLCPSP